MTLSPPPGPGSKVLRHTIGDPPEDITGNYEYLKDLAAGNVCSTCGGSLNVAWYGREETYCLHCGQCPYPSSVIRQPSLFEEYKQGTELPQFIESNIERRERRKTMTSKWDRDETGLALVARADLGTGEVLDVGKVQGLIKFAEQYHLDPQRGHVVLMYGQPYIGLDGYLYHANRTGKPYQLRNRPLTEDERKSYKIKDDDMAWLAEVEFLDTQGYFSGIGIVTQEEMTAKSKRDDTKLASPVVAAHPWQLCQKRAEWQVMRRAFPIGVTQEAKEG